jgi:hypothetical protein
LRYNHWNKFAFFTALSAIQFTKVSSEFVSGQNPDQRLLVRLGSLDGFNSRVSGRCKNGCVVSMEDIFGIRPFGGTKCNEALGFLFLVEKGPTADATDAPQP